MKILVIEDNKILSNELELQLTEKGYTVDVFNDGSDGLYMLEVSDYNLVILDLGLPSIDGIDILKKIRQDKKNILVLIISARDKIDQRILGLETGADDYLCKPFAVSEVLARVQALFRRNNYHMSNIIKYRDLCFDVKKRILSQNENIIKLNKRELTIFEYLIQNLNVIVSKETIVENITTIDDVFNPKAVEIYIYRLRKKIGPSFNVKTVRGLGYIIS